MLNSFVRFTTFSAVLFLALSLQEQVASVAPQLELYYQAFVGAGIITYLMYALGDN